MNAEQFSQSWAKGSPLGRRRPVLGSRGAVAGVAGCELADATDVRPETTERELGAMLLDSVARVDELRLINEGVTARYSEGKAIHMFDVW